MPYQSIPGKTDQYIPGGKRLRPGTVTKFDMAIKGASETTKKKGTSGGGKTFARSWFKLTDGHTAQVRVLWWDSDISFLLHYRFDKDNRDNSVNFLCQRQLGRDCWYCNKGQAWLEGERIIEREEWPILFWLYWIRDDKEYQVMCANITALLDDGLISEEEAQLRYAKAEQKCTESVNQLVATSFAATTATPLSGVNGKLLARPLQRLCDYDMTWCKVGDGPKGSYNVEAMEPSEFHLPDGVEPLSPDQIVQLVDLRLKRNVEQAQESRKGGSSQAKSGAQSRPAVQTRPVPQPPATVRTARTAPSARQSQPEVTGYSENDDRYAPDEEWGAKLEEIFPED